MNSGPIVIQESNAVRVASAMEGDPPLRLVEDTRTEPEAVATRPPLIISFLQMLSSLEESGHISLNYAHLRSQLECVTGGSDITAGLPSILALLDDLRNNDPGIFDIATKILADYSRTGKQ